MIHLVRHGRTEANAGGRLQGEPLCACVRGFPGCGGCGNPGGGVYKFVPATPFAGGEAITDLEQSPLTAGSVWVARLGLRASDDVPAQDWGQGSNTGAGVWVPLETPADPTTFGPYEMGMDLALTPI